jgi:hypothetical protein
MHGEIFRDVTAALLTRLCASMASCGRDSLKPVSAGFFFCRRHQAISASTNSLSGTGFTK